MHNRVAALTAASVFCAGMSVFAPAGAQSAVQLPDQSSRQSDMNHQRLPQEQQQ